MRERRSRRSEQVDPLFDFQLTSANDETTKFEVCFDGVETELLDRIYAEAETQVKLKNDIFSKLEAAAEAEKMASEVHQDVASSAESENNVVVKYDSNDPLTPAGFEGHHRRMERQERHMQALEKQQFIATVARVKTQQASLLKPDWEHSISHIVRIEDSNDSFELQEKRKLALHEMQKFLERYEMSKASLRSGESNSKSNQLDTLSNDKQKEESKKRDSTKPDSKNKSKSKNKNGGNNKNNSSSSKKQKQKQNLKSMHSSNSKGKGSDLSELDNGPLMFTFRPCAFGYQLPPKPFPPQEFSLPPLLLSEVEAYELIDKLNKK